MHIECTYLLLLVLHAIGSDATLLLQRKTPLMCTRTHTSHTHTDSLIHTLSSAQDTSRPAALAGLALALAAVTTAIITSTIRARAPAAKTATATAAAAASASRRAACISAE